MANDYFRFRQFTVWQQHCAMKVGTDGTLLGAWARGGRRILDVGTGTGLIALMMAQRYAEATVTAIDIDAAAVSQARQNAADSPFASRISIRQADVADMALQPSASTDEGCDSSADGDSTFDAIVSNPPYFTDSLKSPDRQRTMARHTDTLTYRTLMDCARRLLAPDGELSVVVPADQQSRMESEAALAGLFKSRECSVRTSARKPPKRVLMAFTKHSAPLERQELTIGTADYEQLMHDFYLERQP